MRLTQIKLAGFKSFVDPTTIAVPGQLVGVESINRASDHVFGRRILTLNRSIEPEQAADPSFDLKAALT